MPHHWHTTQDGSAQMTAWRHRALTRADFTWFITLSCLIILPPLLATLGSPLMYILLAGFLTAISAAWIAVIAHHKSTGRREVLTIRSDGMALSHQAPRKTHQWQANPYWVQPHLDRDHKIENYLTLRGGPRVVELGSFLTPDERAQLYDELRAHLAKVTPTADP